MAAKSGNQMFVSSLCKYFSLDPKDFVSDVDAIDFKGIYFKMLKSAGKESPKNIDEVMKWLAFAENYPASEDCSGVLNDLNAELVTKSVILGDGLTPSEADIFVFSFVHSSVNNLSDSEKEKLPHVMRWIDYIQNKEGLTDLFGKILVEKADIDPHAFEPQKAKAAAKQEVDLNVKNATQSTKSSGKSEADAYSKKTDAGKKAVGDKESAQDKKKSSAAAPADKEKKKTPAAEPADKDKELSVSLLNIQVGLIRKAWKHPSADSLLVEEIDVGEAKLRQVVSGLAKYCTPEQLTNRLVALITNVKPGKLRDVVSEGLVLCASSEDHSAVEPLLPPEGAKPGERVSFSGIDGKPEDVLNPKKKQLDKITPNLFTDDKGVATFKGIPFMTSAGPCTSSIPKGSIK